MRLKPLRPASQQPKKQAADKKLCENGSEMAGSPIPIGLFDSGAGGLSIYNAIRLELPYQPVIYLADQAHIPYGPRPLAEVRAFAERITRFLVEQGVGLVVVACNAASAAALHHLRAEFAPLRFVGMEPAVKPAAENTHSGVVGVLATPATFQGALYASVVERFANGVTVLQDTCPGLVQQIEAGQLDAPATRAILAQSLQPMLDQRIDTVVLGCTHYPFVIPIIQEIAGPGVRVIDPAPAVARQARRLLAASANLATGPEPGWARFFTTGDRAAFERLVLLFTGSEERVNQATWTGERIAAG
ncbi:MAG TPA: glutamate racemase [Levilinea sp.]|nr:glutamate racemase [Levilinea sp.]